MTSSKFHSTMRFPDLVLIVQLHIADVSEASRDSTSACKKKFKDASEIVKLSEALSMRSWDLPSIIFKKRTVSNIGCNNKHILVLMISSCYFSSNSS